MHRRIKKFFMSFTVTNLTNCIISHTINSVVLAHIRVCDKIIKYFQRQTQNFTFEADKL